MPSIDQLTKLVGDLDRLVAEEQRKLDWAVANGEPTAEIEARLDDLEQQLSHLEDQLDVDVD